MPFSLVTSVYLPLASVSVFACCLVVVFFFLFLFRLFFAVVVGYSACFLVQQGALIV